MDSDYFEMILFSFLITLSIIWYLHFPNIANAIKGNIDTKRALRRGRRYRKTRYRKAKFLNRRKGESRIPPSLKSRLESHINLAKKISSGHAPFYLSNKKILSLDLGLMIAGTTFRGEFESRIKELINEAKKDKDLIDALIA